MRPSGAPEPHEFPSPFLPRAPGICSALLCPVSSTPESNLAATAPTIHASHLAALAPSPAAYLKAARAIDAGEMDSLRPIRLAVLSTFTAQFLQPYLTVEGARRGLALTAWFAPWGQLEQQALDPASELFSQKPDAILVLARLEELAPDLAERFSAASDDLRRTRASAALQRIENVATALRRHSTAPVFVANFAPPARLAAGLADASLAHSQTAFVQSCNDALAAFSKSLPAIFVIDLARAATEHGLRAWADPKLFALARIPFSVTAQIAVARTLARTIRTAFFPPAKVLVLDLDNTLWGGVLGEDGVGGIALGDEYPGNVFKAFQKYLLTLKDRGVLLAIATKNNEADVAELFASHPDCVLKRSDFAAARINWREKSANLLELAAELNLGADAFVFFDDSPFEREEVRRHCPLVRVLEPPASPLGFIDTIEESGAFDRLTFSSEDLQRADLYRQNAARVEAQQTIESTEDFLRSLEMVATIGEVGPDTIERAAQLLAKTNQFNLTTRRHSAAELAAMIAVGAIALWLRLTDRFGDSGLVGIAIAVPGDSWRIDTFLLSCRIIGRTAETTLLAQLAGRVVAGGGRELIGEYLPTAKNALVAEFLPQHDFAACGENRWRFDLSAQPLLPSPFIQIQTP